MPVSLEEIQHFCSGKSIALVGNGSCLLKKRHGKLIDSHDIVIRMNYGMPIQRSLADYTGRRTDIYIGSMSRPEAVLNQLRGSNPKYVFKLIRASSNVSPKLLELPNFFLGDIKEYREVRSEFNGLKPSTGAVALSFLINNIEYANVAVFGFDFFKSASRAGRNRFNSYLYKDHDPQLEQRYIQKIIKGNKVTIYK